MLRLPTLAEIKNGDLTVKDYELPRLSPKQAAFVKEYLIDGVGTRAAIRAGYSVHSAGQTAWGLLNDPDVKAHLDFHRAQVSVRYEITRDRLFRELSTIAFANMDDYLEENDEGDATFDYSKTSRIERGVISELTVETFSDPDDPAPRGTPKRKVRKTKFKLHDKVGAIEKLIKLLGYDTPAPQRVEISGPNGGPVPTVTATMTVQEAAEAYAKMRDEG